MSMIINKADARKTVRDASDDMARAGGNVAATGRRTAHDASETSGGSVRKVTAATDRDVTRKNGGTAEQNLRKAADDMRGAVRRPGETGGDVAAVGRKSTHDASQPSGETVRKVVEATSRDVIRKNAEAAEQNVRKAA